MKVSKGQYLYRLGDQSNSLYIIRSGRIALVRGLEDDETSEIAHFGPGQILGDLAFFAGGPRTSNAKALTDVEYLEIPYTTVAKQLESVPQWVQTITRTLAHQVMDYSNEVKDLMDMQDGTDLPRLVVCRATAALAFLPVHFGIRNTDGSATIDWPTLRTHSNLCFREVSASVMKIAKLLEPLNLCKVLSDENGQADVTVTSPDLLARFVRFYVRAVSRSSPELNRIEPIEFNTLSLLIRPELNPVPIHRGLVEIDLVEFTRFAQKSGHAEVTAVSVDLLANFGIGIQKLSTESSVKLRFHQQELEDRGQFWRIIQALHQANHHRHAA